PRVAREARTDRRVSYADGAGLAGLQRGPETGPSVPTHACPAAPRQQRDDRNPNGGGGVSLVCTSSPGPIMDRRTRGHAALWGHQSTARAGDTRAIIGVRARTLAH